MLKYNSIQKTKCNRVAH